MYCILMDTKTGSFYMAPSEVKFYAYTSVEAFEADRATYNAAQTAILVETEMDDRQEFFTFLYNNGFIYGFLDGEKVRIRKGDVAYYRQNSNELVYAQYLLTGSDDYLKYVKKKDLVTLCSLSEDKTSVFFPTVNIEDGNVAVLTYTDVQRIPDELREKYKGWKVVHMTFDVICIVNGKFVAV